MTSSVFLILYLDAVLRVLTVLAPVYLQSLEGHQFLQSYFLPSLF